MGNKGAASLLFLLEIFLCLSSFFPFFVRSQCNRRPVVFNFGDSNSDTGGVAAMFGYDIAPNGRTFFGQPSGRISDGRLVIDFLCESLHTNYLTPYLESVTSDFRNGVNFAMSGAGTQPYYLPFTLDVQILQFNRFRDRSLRFAKRGFENSLDEDAFKNALYIFDIGHNDVAYALDSFPYEQVLQKIPSFLEKIKDALWNIYEHGGKNFWVHNMGPLGCSPQELSTTNRTTGDEDQYGCIRSLNDAVELFNEGLRSLCEELRSQMQNVTIVYVDIYSIKYDLVANYTKYGFENPLMACCGHGGSPYNWNAVLQCGQADCNICEQESRYISWDGDHYTEAANDIVASKILSTNYSTPRMNFDHFCRF